MVGQAQGMKKYRSNLGIPSAGGASSANSNTGLGLTM